MCFVSAVVQVLERYTHACKIPGDAIVGPVTVACGWDIDALMRRVLATVASVVTIYASANASGLQTCRENLCVYTLGFIHADTVVPVLLFLKLNKMFFRIL